MKRFKAIVLFFIGLSMIACKNNSNESAKTNSQPEEDFIEVSKEQFETEKMQFGQAGISLFSDKINFTGTIVPSVNGRAEISLPFQGLVVHIYCKPGQPVNKGDLLFKVSGIEFIDMQKEFAESAAHLVRLQSEFERQKELTEAKITTKMDYVKAKTMYNAKKAKYNALKIKIQILGLDVSKVEKGEFQDTYTIKAPIKGYITNINTNIGQYVEPQQMITEIIDTDSFQLKLSVFAKDIHHLKVGQKLEYYLTANDLNHQTAKITVVGKGIDNVTKSIFCFAQLDKLNEFNLVNNQFVEGHVIIASDSAYSVPESAVVKSDNENYIFVLEKEEQEIFYLSKLQVETGRKESRLIELKDYTDSRKILLFGGYNLAVE